MTRSKKWCYKREPGKMLKFSVRDGTARPRSAFPSRTSISSEAGRDLERYLQAAEAAGLEPNWRASESAVVEEEV